MELKVYRMAAVVPIRTYEAIPMEPGIGTGWPISPQLIWEHSRTRPRRPIRALAVNAEPQAIATNFVLLNLRHAVSDVVNLIETEVFDPPS